nr:MAG TPA: hypothetical protein [Caudoviricetes sp.]
MTCNKPPFWIMKRCKYFITTRKILQQTMK